MNVITFKSTHHAIKTEKKLKDVGIDIRMIPTPREITASCGLSIKFEDKDSDRIQDIVNNMVQNEEIAINGIYKITRTKEKCDVLRVDKVG